MRVSRGADVPRHEGSSKWIGSAAVAVDVEDAIRNVSGASNTSSAHGFDEFATLNLANLRGSHKGSGRIRGEINRVVTVW